MKEITEASASVGLLLATTLERFCSSHRWCFLPGHKTVMLFTFLLFSRPLRVPVPNRPGLLPCLSLFSRSLSRKIRRLLRKQTNMTYLLTNKSRGPGAVHIVPIHYPRRYIQNIHFPTVLLLAIIVGLSRKPVPECQSRSIDPDPNRAIERSSL